MTATLSELDEMVKQAGITPYTWEMRGDDVYVRHIVSGGIDNPVYGWNRVGTLDEVEVSTRGFVSKFNPPAPGYCPRCQMHSSNMNIHKCWPK